MLPVSSELAVPNSVTVNLESVTGLPGFVPEAPQNARRDGKGSIVKVSFKFVFFFLFVYLMKKNNATFCQSILQKKSLRNDKRMIHLH